MPAFSKKKYFELAKGFHRRRKNCYKIVIPVVHKKLQYAYIGRRLKRRDLRKQWIETIKIAVQEHNINYSRFIYGLNRSNMIIDRKILSDLAQNEPYSYKAVVDEVKIQGKLEEKTKNRPLSLLEAYAKNLIQDGLIKPENQRERIGAYFYGERTTLLEKIKEKQIQRQQDLKL